MGEMTIPAHPPIQELEGLRDDLLAWVTELEDGAQAHLEIEATAASQPAVQLFLSTLAALAAQPVTPVLGANGARLLEMTMTTENEG